MSRPLLNEDQLKNYHVDGYLVLPDFLTEDEVIRLKSACKRLVDEMDPAKEQKIIFSAGRIPAHGQKEYFITSGDKVRYFFENEAFDDQKNLKVDKHLSLNKIGHALHWLVPEFKEVTFSSKMKGIAKSLNFKSPAVVQSMYIFKQPIYGEEVGPHKDCSFLSTEPRQSCVGFWLALEDATPENGCLWFSPGSHRVPTKRRFFRTSTESGIGTDYSAPPDPYDPSKYVREPVKKGTLVLIHGEVDHRSEKNTSENSRQIYTFHIIDTEETTWDPKNWLQPTEDLPFPIMYG